MSDEPPIPPDAAPDEEAQLAALVGPGWERHYRAAFRHLAERPSEVTWNWAAALVPFWLAYRRHFVLQFLSCVAFVPLALWTDSVLESWHRVWSVWWDVAALALACVPLGVAQGLAADRLVRSRARSRLVAGAPPPAPRRARKLLRGPSVIYGVGFAALVFGFVIRGGQVSEKNSWGWIRLRAVPSEPVKARAMGPVRTLTAVVAPGFTWSGEPPRVREAWAVPVTRTAYRMIGGPREIPMGDLIVLELENLAAPPGAALMADSVSRRWSHGCFESAGPGSSTCGKYGPAPDTLFLRLCHPLWVARDADSLASKLEECPFGL